MKRLKSFSAFARAIEKAATELEAAYAATMEAGAVLVETTAKAEIGHYQREDMGPFAQWDELKAATKRAHARAIEKGEAASDAGEDTPLLLTGELRDSLKHESTARQFVVGSESQIMVYQELGTPEGIPPRPVLGPAMYRSAETIANMIGKAVEKTIAGKK